jgi:glyceraldehyde 3-phosphate dehydrogenase
MATQIGINGFGRIGRSVFRILSERDDINVVCINDLFENEQLAYLLQYDTVMGIFKKEVKATEDALYVNDQKIEMTEIRDPAAIPWKDLGVDVVIESTGVFRERAGLEKHLAAGAKKVLLTVPAKDEIDATIVLGVNDDELKAEHRIVSNASCTTNCLAPIAKILDESFGIEEGFITTVHAYTNDQRLADVPHKDFRRSRAAGENIIPTTTGAARAVGKVLPGLKGKLDGLAMRVPVPDGSIVDLVARLAKKASVEDANGAVRKAADGAMKQVLEYSEAPLVSSDIIGNPHSSIFDAMSTSSLDDGYLRVVSWYDNEWDFRRIAHKAGHIKIGFRCQVSVPAVQNS